MIHAFSKKVRLIIKKCLNLLKNKGKEWGKNKLNYNNIIKILKKINSIMHNYNSVI